MSNKSFIRSANNTLGEFGAGIFDIAYHFLEMLPHYLVKQKSFSTINRHGHLQRQLGKFSEH